jgi:XRE family transcriptional regulator, regulator of sulfur utilization
LNVPSSNSKSPLANAVRELRSERGITQEALAHGAGITVGHLSKIERGLANPGWSTVEAISDALGVKLAEVVRRVEKQPDRRT